MRYHESDHFRIGGIVDSRVFQCHACPFEGGEDAMIEHAQAVGHVAVPLDHDDELSRMMDEGCPNG